MRAVPQKIKILKFIWEQGVVSVDDIARHLSFSQKPESIRRALYKLGISQLKYSGVKHGLWRVDKPVQFALLNTYFPELSSFELPVIPTIL